MTGGPGRQLLQRLHHPVGAGGGERGGVVVRRAGGDADGRHAAGVGGGDVLRRVADDDDLATTVEAPAGVPLAALDGARDELGAVGAVRAVAAEAKAAPQVAVRELDLRAALDVA